MIYLLSFSFATMLFLGTAESQGDTPNLYTINHLDDHLDSGNHLE